MPLGSTGGSATVQVIDQRRGGAAIREERANGPNGEEMVRLIVADELAAYDQVLPRKIEGKVGAMQRDPRGLTGTWK